MFIDYPLPAYQTTINTNYVASNQTAAQMLSKDSIFGNARINVIAGENSDAHYGWGGCIVFNSGKIVFIYRKAAGHATSNTAELHAKDSFDGGMTWKNDRIILKSSQHDLRPDPGKLMADNRGGFFVNRASADKNLFFSPLFMYSDDEGESWKVKNIATMKPYTFQSTGGLINLPKSVGGDDKFGFAAFGYLSDGGIDALVTKNNGNSWSQIHEVAVPSDEVSYISEWGGTRVGKDNKWIFVARSKKGNQWNDNLILWTTNNPLHWGKWKNSGLGLNGNPPSIVYDDSTKNLVFLTPSRKSRVVKGFSSDTLLEAKINGEFAYNNPTKIAQFTKYNEIAKLPTWFTSYLAPFKYGKKWYTTLTAGEKGNAKNGAAIQILIGEHTTSNN